MSQIWYLIDNDKHDLYSFPSSKMLRKYAKELGMKIKRSPTEDHTFYIKSYVYVPGNQ
jgi:hypothetical protein